MVCTIVSWSEHGNRQTRGCFKVVGKGRGYSATRSTAMSKPTSHVVLLLARGGGSLELQAARKVLLTCLIHGARWGTLLLWL